MNGFFRSSADLFAELNRLQGLVDQAFGPADRTSIRGQQGAGFPVLNVGATPDSVEVMALAPGLDADKLELSVDRGLLIIAGERASQLPEDRERTNLYASERFTGRFRRVVSLPEDADPQKVEASYRDGILRVSVAKRESSKPRRITVN
ncbi:MAG: Hsp20/alpha crystallin family protein [Burkholderiales bacterium]|nr:Hsp20/alpha crystallin family protein [Burkholderiales bacterium]